MSDNFLFYTHLKRFTTDSLTTIFLEVPLLFTYNLSCILILQCKYLLETNYTITPGCWKNMNKIEENCVD